MNKLLSLPDSFLGLFSNFGYSLKFFPLPVCAYSCFSEGSAENVFGGSEIFPMAHVCVDAVFARCRAGSSELLPPLG